MSDTKTIVKGSFWVYTTMILSLFIGFITTVVLSRVLDRDNWGIFATVISVSYLLSVFVDLGFSYTLTHYTSTLSTRGQYDKLRRYLVKISKYRFLLILIVASIIFASSDFLTSFFHIVDGAKYFQVSSLFFIFSNLFNTFDYILNGLKKFKANSILYFLNYFLKLVFALILSYIGFGVIGALVGYAIAYVFTIALVLYILKDLLIPPKHNVSADEETDAGIKELFIFGGMVGVAQLASTVTLWTDSIMIGTMMGATFVGVYKIAMSMSITLGGAISSVNKVLFPVLVSIEAKKEESVSDLNRVLKYGSFFAIPASFGLAIFSTEIISVFFGQQYIDAAPALFILSYFCFDSFIIGSLVSYFSAKREIKIIGLAAIFCAIANVILNFVLIPTLGIIGAAIASIITRIMNLGILLFEGRKINLYVSFDNFQKPLLGAIVMALVLILLKQFVVVSNILLLGIFVSIGLLVYVAFEALLGFNILIFGRKVLNLLLEK